MKPRKYIFVLLTVVLLLGSTVFAAYAAIPKTLLIMDAEGMKADPEKGQYHVRVDDMIPGVIYEHELEISNFHPTDPFKVYMRAEPVSSTGDADLFKYVTMTLSLDDVEFYRGSPNGLGSIDMQTKEHLLGTWKSGRQARLHMTAVLAKDIPEMVLESYGTGQATIVTDENGKKISKVVESVKGKSAMIEFLWIFTAEYDAAPTTTAAPTTVPFNSQVITTNPPYVPTDPPTTQPPRPPWVPTGLQSQLFRYSIVGVVALMVLVVFIFWLKATRKEKEAQGAQPPGQK